MNNPEYLSSFNASKSALMIIQLQKVNTEGYPKKPISISIPVDRKNISINSMRPEQEVKISVQKDIGDKIIHAKVVAIHHFPDGDSIVMDTISGYLKEWKRIILWVPIKGQCGILWPYIKSSNSCFLILVKLYFLCNKQ